MVGGGTREGWGYTVSRDRCEGCGDRARRRRGRTRRRETTRSVTVWCVACVCDLCIYLSFGRNRCSRRGGDASVVADEAAAALVSCVDVRRKRRSGGWSAGLDRSRERPDRLERRFRRALGRGPGGDSRRRRRDRSVRCRRAPPCPCFCLGTAEKPRSAVRTAPAKLETEPRRRASSPLRMMSHMTAWMSSEASRRRANFSARATGRCVARRSTTRTPWDPTRSLACERLDRRRYRNP